MHSRIGTCLPSCVGTLTTHSVGVFERIWYPSACAAATSAFSSGESVMKRVAVPYPIVSPRADEAARESKRPRDACAPIPGSGAQAWVRTIGSIGRRRSARLLAHYRLLHGAAKAKLVSELSAAVEGYA